MELVNGPAILRWALACNARARNQPEAQEVGWAKGGEDRLRQLAIQFGQQLSLNQLPGGVEYYGNYRQYAAALVCQVAEGPVFREKGPETARDLLLCLLYAAGFRLQESAPGGAKVAEEIGTRLRPRKGHPLSPDPLSDLIGKRFMPPATPGAGGEFSPSVGPPPRG